QSSERRVIWVGGVSPVLPRRFFPRSQAHSLQRKAISPSDAMGGFTRYQPRVGRGSGNPLYPRTGLADETRRGAPPVCRGARNRRADFLRWRIGDRRRVVLL